MASVRVVHGPDEGHTIELSDSDVVLGRDASCDHVLSDPRTSRRHAKLVRGARGWMIEDLGSSLGTYVDGERIEGLARLREGDTIRVGHTTLVFSADAPAEPSPAPPKPQPVKRRRTNEQDELARIREALRRLPEYEVLEEVGRGAMGYVYRAQRRHDRRIVAMKLLAPRLAARKGFAERLHREARAVASLDHPRAVRVLDDGEFAGLHYFVMEYLPGGSVQEILDEDPEHRLPVRETMAILADVAGVLAHAHSIGIVHRDVKPANLVIDGIGRAKLTDFGIAIDAEARTKGGRVGTPHFMSPEQARGHPATYASDVYSLGATGYTLLAGRTPFPAGSAHEVIARVAKQVPERLSHLAPHAPPELIRVIERAMSRDPAARYSDAEAMARALRAVESGTKRAGRGEAPIAVRRRRERSPVVPLLLVTLLLGVLAGVGWHGHTQGWFVDLDERFDEAIERERRSAEELFDAGRSPAEPDTMVDAERARRLLEARAHLDRLDARRAKLPFANSRDARLAVEYESFAADHAEFPELAAEARRAAEELAR